MSEEPYVDPSCEVCGRRLLPGERPTDYVTRDGATAIVCELCRPRAEAAGWLLPDEAAARGGTGRDRRRPRGQMLGGLLARLPAAGNGGEGPGSDQSSAGLDGAPRRGSSRSRGGSAEASKPSVAVPLEGGDSSGTTMPEALAAFNASNHRRTVAGLSRTLGAPRASGLAVRASSGYPGARVTVAWELTWYQWEIGPGPRGPEVRESGKGETIDQLRAADRTWNLLVDSDGTLQQRSITPAAGETGG